MCSGKTIIGKKIAEFLQCEFIDLDAEFEKQAGITITEYIKYFGETSFRELESKILQVNLKKCKQSIVATGGGVVQSKENIELINKNNSTIFLNPSWHEIWKRISKQSNYNTRPILHDKTKVEVLNMYEKRLVIYKELANFEINDDNILLNMMKEIVGQND